MAVKSQIVVLLALLVLVSSCSQAADKQQWTINSPDGKLSVALKRSSCAKKYLSYQVQMDGQQVVLTGQCGVEMAGSAGNFSTGLVFIEQSEQTISETYPMVSGKKSIHENYCNQKTLVFKNASGEIMHLIFRAYNDGIAWRYYFDGSGSREITSELSNFTLPEKTIGWLQDYKPDYQGYYPLKSAADDVEKDIGFPALFKTPTDVWILVTEASVYGDYAGCRLEGAFSKNNTFKVKLPQDKLSSALPWKTPWRTAIIGKNLGTIVESVLVDNLNPACELEDTSWIKPGRVSFPWLTDHTANKNFETLTKFVDLASEMGWEYTEIDTAAIDCDNGLRGCDHWMTEPLLGKIDKLIKYARSKGVDVFGWSHWLDLEESGKRKEILKVYNELGIAGIKADFMENDSQKSFQWRDDFIKDCAERKIMISLHGSTLPRGQRRRWPHIMTWESILGEEWYTLPNAKNPRPPATPAHNCTIPFTRNVVGPMDYTPTVFSFDNNQTTNAHELAMSVIYESGWQCLSDSPESYNASPAKPFLKDVPAAWDDIHFIDGAPGEFCCLGRRKGGDWYIAAINAESARTIKINLSFLKQGSYTTRIYKDGSDKKTILAEDLTIDTSKPFEISIPAKGGFCMKIAGSSK